jgi:hypothetical protein
MKNISTGAGLAIVGLGIALHPVLSYVLAATPNANAAAPVSVVASTATGPAVPTVVWMGVTQNRDFLVTNYHRMWSDGRQEARSVAFEWSQSGCSQILPISCGSQWIEIPPPPGGNGFACRSDINGDRIVNGADLTIMLNAWGQEGGCEPEATYPCLDLGSLTNAAAMK